MGINTLNDSAWSVLSTFGEVVFTEPMPMQEFIRLCERFPDLLIERDREGKVIVMAPVKSASGRNEGYLFGYLFAWFLGAGKPGEVYSPSTGFRIGKEEVRCGDATWVSAERLQQFHTEPNHGKKFVAAVPDFVVEVKSDTDRINKLKTKMSDAWMAAGVRLGWLIDPDAEVAYIYRAGIVKPEEVRGFTTATLSGEDVLPGFVFPLVELSV